VDGKEIDQAGAGAWAFDAWPEYDAGDVGQELPTGTVKPVTPAEVGCSLVAVCEAEGRPAMVKRMETEGLPGTGSDRAYRLHNFGKELDAWLVARDYVLRYEPSAARAEAAPAR
jgi:hypothetical protein